MEIPPLSQQEIKALEQTRQRLSQLQKSLATLHQNILQSDPLPEWSSMQSLASIISQNLSSTSQHLNTHRDLFAAMAVYPLPGFPGRTQENLLGQLLRKKLEPNVEDWVSAGRDIAISAQTHDQALGIQPAQTRELWSWAGMAANEQARKHTWGGNFTLEERERGIQHVVTGLRRTLRDDEDEEGESEEEDEEAVEEGEDGDAMEIVAVRRKSSMDGVEFDLVREREHKEEVVPAPALSLNDHFRFLMTGAMPRA